MALSDLPDVLGMEERGASSNSGGFSVESYKEIFSKEEVWTSNCQNNGHSRCVQVMIIAD